MSVRNVGATSNRPYMKLSVVGETVKNALSKLDEYILIDKYVIMPNHMHDYADWMHRANGVRPYNIINNQVLQIICDKTSRAFHMAEIILRPYYS